MFWADWYPHGVWWYFPAAISIKTTLGMLALVLLAGFAIVTRKLGKGPDQSRALVYVLFVWARLPCYGRSKRTQYWGASRSAARMRWQRSLRVLVWQRWPRCRANGSGPVPRSLSPISPPR